MGRYLSKVNCHKMYPCFKSVLYYSQEIKDHYLKKGAEEGPQEIISIISDRVGLKIPVDGVNLADIQWSLTPLTNPMVRLMNVPLLIFCLCHVCVN